MHVLHAERIWMQGVLFRVCVCWGCWREYAVSFRPGALGMRGWFLLAPGRLLRAENRRHNSLRSDKCHRFSNAVTRELRGSQIPGSCTPVRKLTAGGWWDRK